MDIYQHSYQLLTHLNKATFAQSMLLSFHLPIDSNDVGEVLLRNLQAGTFQHEFILQDLESEFPNYSSMAINNGSVIFVPEVAKLWNGNHPEYQEINKNTLKEHLIDLLCGGQIYTPPTTPLSKTIANQVIDEWFDYLNQKDWQVFLIKPNFLYTTEQAKNSGFIYMGYFENFGRDVAIAIRTKDKIHLLLVNGWIN